MIKNNNNFYDEKYLQKNPGWHEDDAEFKYQNIETILNKNGLDNFATIADFGCGTGDVLNLFYKKNHSIGYHGFDLSSTAISIAKKKNISINFTEIGDISQVSELFDLIICNDVFEHVDDYIGFLRKLKMRGRYFVFHIPLDINLLDIFRGNRLSYKFVKAGHLHYFTKETALQSLEYSGYKIIDYSYTMWYKLHNKPFRNFIIDLINKVNPDLFPRFFGGHSIVVLCE